MKKKIFLKIGFLSGLIPLLVGLIIFFSWLVSRNYYGIDLWILATAGFYWVLISVLVATIGLLLLILYIFKNKGQFYKRSILYIILILLNIPIAYVIINKVQNIYERAYLKIYNHAKQDLVHLTFNGTYYYKDLGDLKIGDYKVVYFTPRYSNWSLQNAGITDSFYRG